jgi:transposase
LGIDHHKRFSYVVALNDSNNVLWEGPMASDPEAFQNLKDALPPEPIQSVLEAGRNWGPLFDALEDMNLSPHLANPLKSRLIAESFQKTDKFDAHTLAWMLKAGITPVVHVPSKDIRDQKNLLRQRLWLVKLQTALKNRIHALLDRNHLKPPEKSDVFGSFGRAWMNALVLQDPDGLLLKDDLLLLDQVRAHLRDTERWITAALKNNPLVPLLRSLPGIGDFFAALIALELDTTDRFPSPEKLCSYAGLVSSTYSSGGHTYHGRLVPTCNHFLRYAFIEAAWTAVRVSPYFKAYYERMKSRKGSSTAVGAAARKLCEIAYHCLKKNRAYQERPYIFGRGALAFS